MAWVRCCGGSSKGQKKMLYDNGAWSVSYLNPGTYAYSNAGSGWVLESDKFSTTSAIGSIIGSAIPVDCTDFTTLHIKAKHISGGAGTTGFISTQANYTGGVIRTVAITTIGQEVDYTLDVSDRTTAYFGVISVSGNVDEVYEIYLT